MNTLNVTMEAGAFMNPENKGHYIHLGTGVEYHQNLNDYLGNLKAGDFGWLETNHKGLSLHFRVSDEGAEFTNASGTASDLFWLTKLYGEDVCNKLTRYMNIRN